MNDEEIISIVVLNQILAERRIRNARYSLRAFARDIDVSASNLSMIMSRKKRLSCEQACKIAIRLNFSKELFFDFVSSTVVLESFDLDN